jgi:hypothetical protein
MFRELIARAESAGALRNDFVPEDLPMLLMANAGVISGTGDAAPGTWRRLVAYLIQAFATDAEAFHELLWVIHRAMRGILPNESGPAPVSRPGRATKRPAACEFVRGASGVSW